MRNKISVFAAGLLGLVVLLGTVLLGGTGAGAQQTTTAAANPRVALVLGNSSYRMARQLPNARGDADAMATMLRRIGFEVTLGTDLPKSEMIKAVERFSVSASQAQVALLFYAGHGSQVAGKNYLIPIDFDLQAARPDLSTGYELDEILGRVRSVSGVTVILLDACRDDVAGRPGSGPRVPTPRQIGAGGGFASVQATGQTFIAFATAPGKTAEDGNGLHSPFTQALLQNIERPLMEIEPVFKLVGAEVQQTTGGKQVPWVNSSLTTPVMLNPAARGQERRTGESAGSAPLDRSPGTAAQCDDRFADAVISPDRVGALRAFRDTCTTHPKLAEANQLLAMAYDDLACDQALTQRTITALRNYERAHPVGSCIKRVQQEISRLELDRETLDSSDRRKIAEQQRLDDIKKKQDEVAADELRVKQLELKKREQLALVIPLPVPPAQPSVPRTLAPPPAPVAPAPVASTIVRHAGQYVEGEGFQTTLNSTYELCADLCESNARCTMVEFHKPERKCNLFAHRTISGAAKDSDIGVKRGGSVTVAAPAPQRAALGASPGLKKRPGQYVEGEGYVTRYNLTYDQCAELCQTDGQCQMVELHRPEKKCSLFNHKKISGAAKDSDVGVK